VLAVLFSLVGFSIGVAINAWLALFNMLPIGPLDGSKVLSWNPIVWVGIVAVSVLFLAGVGFF